MFDPSEPTREVHLSAWDAEVIGRILQSPAAAVYGTDNNLRIINLITKIDNARQQFIEAGAYQKIGDNAPAPDMGEVKSETIIRRPKKGKTP